VLMNATAIGILLCISRDCLAGGRESSELPRDDGIGG
jgi:hypothetical protein